MNHHATLASFGYVESPGGNDDDGPPPAGDGIKGIARYYGKYRGTVLPVPDLKRIGRLFVQVSDINGPNITNWARPCFLWAGTGMGVYSVPPPGTKVWVEFEHGHPDYPIWVGCRWETPLETPTVARTSAPLAPIWAVETFAQHALIISDTPVLPWLPLGGILLKSGASYIAVEPQGVRIFGAPGGVMINSLDGTLASAGLHVT